MKRALITGITGQTGAYLSKLLLEKGYEVYGGYRRTSNFRVDNLKVLGIDRKVKLVPLELLEFMNIYRIIEKVNPDEIYNLGGAAFVPISFEEPIYTAESVALGPLRILEVIRTINPKIKFYQASSAEIFGKVNSESQNEDTYTNPQSPHAISKLFGHLITKNYRESYNIFACNGILFGHESPLRGLDLVSKKIVYSVVRIKKGLQNELRLGNIDSKRDWGYTPEYVEAMWLMLQQDKPDDYVIATDETHSIREFVTIAFREVGVKIMWCGIRLEEKGIDTDTGKVLVVIDPQFFRPAEVNFLKGDYTKAKKKFGWFPKTTFKELVKILVNYELENL